MQKEQSKGIVLKHEIKRERVVSYPFFLVSTTYSHEPEYRFIATIDYNYDTTILYLYPFQSDMSKMTPSTISLSDILSKKAVTTIYIHSLKYRTYTGGLTITQAEFVLGHKSGQVVLIHYKDKECKMVQRFNKSLKGESFFSKTSSFFFGNQQTYSPFTKDVVKTFRKEKNDEFSYSYQVGNKIVFLDSLLESREASFLGLQEQNNAEAYAFHYDFNTQAKKGSLYMYGTGDYYSLKDKEHNVAMITFNAELSSYLLLPDSKNELVVALGSNDTILIIETFKFETKTKIQTQMTIRKLNFFKHLEHGYLAILVYDNYLILYDLVEKKYCKLIGHRSFISSVAYDKEEQMLVCAGMDHRISLNKLSPLKEKHWQVPEVINKIVYLEDSDLKGERFQDIYSLGEYDNKRSNLHSYGFADLIMLDRLYCIMTYDAKIMMYRYI